MRTGVALLGLLFATTQAVGGAEISVADGGTSVGSFTAIVRGTDGLGLISYYDADRGHLKVRHCSNASCSEGTGAVLDDDGLVGLDTSITIGSDGRGLISYLDY